VPLTKPGFFIVLSSSSSAGQVVVFGFVDGEEAEEGEDGDAGEVVADEVDAVVAGEPGAPHFPGSINTWRVKGFGRWRRPSSYRGPSTPPHAMKLREAPLRMTALI
jgi:hypothetical protein